MTDDQRLEYIIAELRRAVALAQEQGILEEMPSLVAALREAERRASLKPTCKSKSCYPGGSQEIR